MQKAGSAAFRVQFFGEVDASRYCTSGRNSALLICRLEGWPHSLRALWPLPFYRSMMAEANEGKWRQVIFLHQTARMWNKIAHEIITNKGNVSHSLFVVNLAPFRPTDKVAMTDIAVRLGALELENFEHKSFIPFSELKKLFTRDKVYELLRQHDLHFHLINEIVDRVLDGDLRIFAVLRAV